MSQALGDLCVLSCTIVRGGLKTLQRCVVQLRSMATGAMWQRSLVVWLVGGWMGRCLVHGGVHWRGSARFGSNAVAATDVWAEHGA